MIQLLVINDNSFPSGSQTYNGVGFEVTIADTPLVAFNQIIHISPDAIVLNTTNPGMDYLQVLKRIRHMQASKDVPMLIMLEGGHEGQFAPFLEDGKTELRPRSVGASGVFEWIIKRLEVPDTSGQKQIMVVDDDPVVLDLTKLYLGAKYRVIAMNKATDVVPKLRTMKPDLILLDIAMPDIDGKDLFKQIKAVEGCENIPILFQTGMAGINTVRECVKLGATGFVLKPLQKPVILERVEECFKSDENNLVYVIEDYDFMYSLISGFIKDEYTVERGESVLQSINHLEELDPAVIILDLDNSSFMLARLREKAEELSIPIILLTANTSSDIAMKERHSENTAIIPLPLNKETVREAVKIMADKKKVLVKSAQQS